MSLAKEAAGGFLWATAASLGARLLTVVSTFLLTRYLSPEVQGELNLALVFVTSVGAATALGVAQYVAAHPSAGRSTVFHGSVLVLGTGVLSCLFCIGAAPYAAAWLDAPRLADYVPGLVLAQWLDRCGWVPRSLLVREMRFRALALRVAAGELTFAVSSVATAALGLGGHAIVAGNIARSAVMLGLVLAATGLREHLSPCPLSRRTFRDILSFGTPITVAQFFRLGATSWDNSLMGVKFGGATVGVYNQAYRLAELPATSVGDPLNDVLVPTFARLQDPAARVRGFLRAAALLGLLVSPMAAGLAIVSRPLVTVFYPPAYAGIAPFLAVLAGLGVARAFASLAGAFLQATGRTRNVAVQDILLTAGVLGSMALLARWGAVFSAAGVSLAFLGNAVLLIRALRPEGVTLAGTLRAVTGPLVACLPMTAAVLALRLGLSALHVAAGPALALEIACGALVYSAAAWLVAGAAARDLLALTAAIFRRRSSALPPAGEEVIAQGGAQAR